jgi:hypothetical protein
MSEKVLQSLEGVSETLLITLYVRARESQRRDGMIKDDLAVAMVNQIDCDFSRLRMQRHDEVAVIMRMNKFDSYVRNFLQRSPDAVVVHIGCGLVCDAHTPFVIWADNLHLAFAKVKARMHWSIKQGKEVEAWGEGIILLDEWNYYEDDVSQLKAFRWVRMIPALAKSSGIFQYRLGA